MPPTSAKRRAAESKKDPHLRRLQESVVGRTSGYFATVGDLVQRRSLEPKEWLGGYARLWQNVVGDVGDWILAETDTPLRPTDEWVRRVCAFIPKKRQTISMSVDVPLAAFGNHRAVTLVTDGLSRGNQQVILAPGRHVHLPTYKIPRSERRAVRIRFSDLQHLQVGIYSGMLCVRETDVTVAILELTVR
jgi:hypothetical protein